MLQQRTVIHTVLNLSRRLRASRMATAVHVSCCCPKRINVTATHNNTYRIEPFQEAAGFTNGHCCARELLLSKENNVTATHSNTYRIEPFQEAAGFTNGHCCGRKLLLGVHVASRGIELAQVSQHIALLYLKVSARCVCVWVCVLVRVCVLCVLCVMSMCEFVYVCKCAQQKLAVSGLQVC